MTGLVGAVVEAWDELRIHRLRVLLALIGVAVAVAAITGVTAAVQMLAQAYDEQMDRDMGRQVTLQVNAWPMTATTAAPDLDAAYGQALERYQIDYATRTLYTSVPLRTADGAMFADLMAVDPDYGLIYRVAPIEGRWFADADTGAYAPLLVVNEAFLAAIGQTDLAAHPTVLLGDDDPVTATVIGVTADRWPGETPSGFWLYDHMSRWWQTDPAMGPTVPALAAWVPTDQVDGLSERLSRDIGAVLPGWQVDVYDNRQIGIGMLDNATRWIAIGVGGFALLLGGLGLLNIALVSVRYRIREIGIRRSFGATSGRVFFGVLMESVVATVVAGLVGVAIAVAVLKAIPVDTMFGTGLQDVPPFPISAALIGMAAATGVGALAGLIPATVAVRVPVIDAIRY